MQHIRRHARFRQGFETALTPLTLAFFGQFLLPFAFLRFLGDDECLQRFLIDIPDTTDARAADESFTAEARDVVGGDAERVRSIARRAVADAVDNDIGIAHEKWS